MRPGGRASLRILSTIGDPGSFWKEWDSLVERVGTNPFYLGAFVRHYMGRYLKQGWTPRLVEMSSDVRLVGIAAFRTKGILGARLASFLLPYGYGTEFLAEPEHLGAFISMTLENLLRKTGCQDLDLIFPIESPSLGMLKGFCNSLQLKFRSPPLTQEFSREHSVLQVEDTWDEFERKRGGNFARHYAKIEQKLGRAGAWKIEKLTIDGPEQVRIVKEIERNSWKQEWRERTREETDQRLVPYFELWKQGSSVRNSLPILWLLRLNDSPIAYAIAMQLNGVAMLCETTYVNRYREFYPGDLIQNTAIRDLYESGEVSLIDFLTYLPYHSRWTSSRLARERVAVSKPVPLLSPFVSQLGRSGYTRPLRRVLRRLSK